MSLPNFDEQYIKDISEALTAARRNLKPLADFPGELPGSIEDAYSIQDYSIEHWDDKIVGWKVGGIPAFQYELYGSGRLVGPVFEKPVQSCADGDTVKMGGYPEGFAAIEAEYIVVLKDVLNLPDRDVSLDDMPDIVESIHVGMELASSPMLLVNALGATSIISDFGCNAGCVIGPKISNPMDIDFTKHEVSVTIDGNLAGSKPSGNGMAGPFNAVIFLINHMRARGKTLPGGLFVSTGAISGVHQTEIGTHSVINFEGLGSLNIDLVPLTNA